MINLRFFIISMDYEGQYLKLKKKTKDLLNKHLKSKIDQLIDLIYNDYTSKTKSQSSESEIKQYVEKLGLYFGGGAVVCQNCKLKNEMFRNFLEKKKLTLCEKCLNNLKKSCTKKNTIKIYSMNKEVSQIIFEVDDTSNIEKIIKQNNTTRLASQNTPTQPKENQKKNNRSFCGFDRGMQKKKESNKQKQVGNNHNITQPIKIHPKEIMEKKTNLNRNKSDKEIMKDIPTIKDKININTANDSINQTIQKNSIEDFYEELKNNFKCVSNYKKTEVYSAIEEGKYDEEKVLEILLSKPYCHLS